MNDAEHAKLVALEGEGKVLLGVYPAAARRFFMDIPIANINEATGYTPYFEKGFTILFFALGPLALIVGTIVSVFSFGWWGLAALAMFPLFYGYQATVSLGNKRPYAVTILLIIVVAAHLLDIFSVSSLTRIAVLFVFALWSVNFLYVACAGFYRAMALQSAKVFNVLAPGVTIKHVD